MKHSPQLQKGLVKQNVMNHEEVWVLHITQLLLCLTITGSIPTEHPARNSTWITQRTSLKFSPCMGNMLVKFNMQ